jgi:hypothetical protein
MTVVRERWLAVLGLMIGAADRPSTPGSVGPTIITLINQRRHASEAVLQAPHFECPRDHLPEFLIPFANFTTSPFPDDVEAYQEYRRNGIRFVEARNRRMADQVPRSRQAGSRR